MTDIFAILTVNKLILVCKIVVPLIFENVRRRKKVYNKCKSEKKYPRQIQHPVTDLKKKLLAKIVSDFEM